MRVRQRQLTYGLAFGSSAFLAGLLVAILVTPQSVLSGVARWKAATWVFFSAHFMPIQTAVFTRVDVIAQVPALQSLRVVPILLTTAGGLATVLAVGYTPRFTHILQNSAAVIVGYVASGVVVFIASGARPGVALIVVGAAVIGAAAYIGATLTQSLTADLPVFAVTSLGGIVAIGLLVLVGGVAVLSAFLPLVGIAGAGAVVAAIVAWVARNGPR